MFSHKVLHECDFYKYFIIFYVSVIRYTVINEPLTYSLLEVQLSTVGFNSNVPLVNDTFPRVHLGCVSCSTVFRIQFTTGLRKICYSFLDWTCRLLFRLWMEIWMSKDHIYNLVGIFWPVNKDNNNLVLMWIADYKHKPKYINDVFSGPHGSLSVHVCCLHLKTEFCSCARGRQWCGIIHYYWWTASIKPRLLFSRARYVSWGLFLSSVFLCIELELGQISPLFSP